MCALSVVSDLNKQERTCFAFSLLVPGSLNALHLMILFSLSLVRGVGYISSIVGSSRASPRGPD